MTEITGLAVEGTDDKGRTYYEQVTARVRGVSQYNSNQYSLDGLPGYWEWQGESPLAKEQAYEFKLSSKPKTGDRAKPGSRYQDIRSAVATDSAPTVQPRQSDSQGPPRRYLDEPWADGEAAKRPERVPVDDVQTRIEKGQALNIAANFLTMPGEGGSLYDGVPVDELRQWRDRIYWEVIKVPVASPHHCYKHEQPRILSKTGKWGHLVEDADPCVEE